MKVLVTGASGYIGRKVVDELISMNHTVIACDIRFDKVNEKARKCSTPIFEDDENLYDKLERPDVCIHLAWRDGFNHNSDAHMEDLPRHYRFISRMMSSGLKHFVGMGSMHEIGYYEGAVDENTPTNPLSFYGIAKNALRQASEIIVKKNNGIYSWIRGYYILGDDKHNHSIFTKIMEMDKQGEKTFPFTTGKNKYDFLDVNDLAKQIASVAVQEKVTGIVNCCSGKPVSLADRVEMFIKENNLSIKLEYGKFPDRPYDSPAIWGDNTKITEIINNRER